MNKTKLLIIGGVLIIIVAGSTQFFFPRSAISPTLPIAEQNVSATTTNTIATTTAIRTQKSPMMNPLPLAQGDTVASWNFQGAYAGNPELVAKADAEIKRLSNLLVTATSSATILSVGIANQYGLLGDGSLEYEYLIRAVKAGGATSGLPWHNLGVLMERLGAYKTARIAYEKSTLVQPELKFYHYAYLEFLTARTKNDIVHIEKAFAAAGKYFSGDTYVLQLRVEWEKS
ncbi:MAG: hypothetical protein AAB850_01000 [Patescibacteria group bacterium]